MTARRLASLRRSQRSYLGKIISTTFALANFKRAVEAAALMQGLELTAIVP
jgi:alcohol dehydrogenase